MVPFVGGRPWRPPGGQSGGPGVGFDGPGGGINAGRCGGKAPAATDIEKHPQDYQNHHQDTFSRENYDHPPGF